MSHFAIAGLQLTVSPRGNNIPHIKASIQHVASLFPCSVIDPEGRVVVRYRKMFPFRPYSVDVDTGTDFVVFDVPDVGAFGLSIRYDIWFPEHARTLACMGAEVILLRPISWVPPRPSLATPAGRCWYATTMTSRVCGRPACGVPPGRGGRCWA